MKAVYASRQEVFVVEHDDKIACHLAVLSDGRHRRPPNCVPWPHREGREDGRIRVVTEERARQRVDGVRCSYSLPGWR
jgi:hypothetical protein